MEGKCWSLSWQNLCTWMENLDLDEPIDPKTLNRAQRRRELRALNLISKEKSDGTLKGRTVADGRPQRLLYHKLHTASPIVSTNALMFYILIDAYEGRDVANSDVVGADLNGFMDDFVILRFDGESVAILRAMNKAFKLLYPSRATRRFCTYYVW